MKRPTGRDWAKAPERACALMSDVHRPSSRATMGVPGGSDRPEQPRHRVFVPVSIRTAGASLSHAIAASNGATWFACASNIATGPAPWIGTRMAARIPPPSAFRTTSGAMASISSRNCPVRSAIRNRSTTACCSDGRTCTRDRRAFTCTRARRAICRTAAADLPMAAATSPSACRGLRGTRTLPVPGARASPAPSA